MCHTCYGQRKVGQCSKHDLLSIDSPSGNICYLTGHEKNELKYFCCEKSCCKAVCANCVVESHKEHTYKPVADEYEERKKLMLRFCEATKNKITNAKRFLDTIRQKRALVTKSDKDARIRLMKQVERGTKYIIGFQEETEKDAEEKLQKCVKMLERREEQLQSYIENSTECCAISEEALLGENMVAFLSVEKTLTEKLKSFEQSDVDKPLESMPPTSDFELKEPTQELESRIDCMTRKSGGTLEKLSFMKEVWKILRGKTTKTQERPSCLNVFISLLFSLFLYACLLLHFHPVPYSRIFDIDHTYLAFRKSQSSQMCFSTDKRMVSNIPIENMRQTCGNTQTPYIFGGAFTNRSFIFGMGSKLCLMLMYLKSDIILRV
uniref:Uncharacterized protein LOC111107624 n=1 Tax=Crassostrea virginica TaxID=6565 RepID=A0A8B8B5C0_CRAVI|nr:uncharacterized protein LOC111107624 [Crassostrea virginica]